MKKKSKRQSPKEPMTITAQLQKIRQPVKGQQASTVHGRFYFSLGKTALQKTKILSELSKFQKEMVEKTAGQWHRIVTDGGVLFIYWLEDENNKFHSYDLSPDPFTRVKGLSGVFFSFMEEYKVDHVEVHLGDVPGFYEAFSVGWEIANYQFKFAEQGSASLKTFSLAKAVAKNLSLVEAGKVLGQSVNLARHLVNLPPNKLYPESYANALKGMFSGPGIKVEVYTDADLKREKMHLHLAVGQGSEHPPRLVHLQYRNKKSKGAPWAFVGKGITFDSGGLDIKPSSGMRLMKKDMGGSAALVGFANWVIEQKIPQDMDFYFAMAENSVGSRSFRPGDIVKARSGLSVEIHNTDAEGRLVMADAIDFAVSAPGKNKPTLLVDVATLTGAIKVGLGSEVAGLFANGEELLRDFFH
ncbi:MAG: leucyl aminopeptidase family protein, partial [Bdellovibrionales bacterium]|nr:leucyl aminopeptidase family protein [Bdellovibrionales bacterium]